MTNARRLLSLGAALLVIVAVGVSYVQYRKKAGESVVVATPPDYSSIGRGRSPLCAKSAGPNECKGFPPVDFRDSAPLGVLNAFLNPSRFTEESGPIQMEPESGPDKQTFWVSAVKESRRFEFRQQLNDYAHVVARIRADPAGPKDRMYKIGGFTEPMRNYFYLVVRKYDARDASEPPDLATVGPSRRISRWEIYGVETRGQPRLKLVSSGEVRWCGHPHATTPTGSEATVRYCPRDSVTAAANSAPDPSAALQIASSIQRFRDPPLWFTCGIGCCIADMTQ